MKSRILFYIILAAYIVSAVIAAFMHELLLAVISIVLFLAALIIGCKLKEHLNNVHHRP